MIEEIKEALPQEKQIKQDDMGSVFERKDEIGSVFEKPKAPAGEIDRGRFKDIKHILGQLKIELEDKYKPKIEPLKRERKIALANPKKINYKEERDKREQKWKDTVGKELEAEKQELKRQEELKKQKQEQEKKDKQAKELKPKTAPEIGGPSGLGR